MKRILIIAIFAMFMASCGVLTKGKKSSATDSTLLSKPANTAVIEKINSDTLFAGILDLTHKVGYLDSTGKFYIVAPVYQDSALVYDSFYKTYVYVKFYKTFIAYIPVDEFKKMKEEQQIVLVYASWMKITKGKHYVVEAGSDLEGSLVKLVFQYGAISTFFAPVKVNTQQQGSSSGSSPKPTNQQGGCPTTPCPEGKVRNPATCNCEPKSNR